MFTEIEKKCVSLPFGAINLWLRYDNAAFLKIEKSGYDPFDIKKISEDGKTARVFLEAGLEDCLSSLGLTEKGGGIINAILCGNDVPEIIFAIERAVLSALPKPSGTPKNGGSGGMENLFSFFVDIMKNDEKSFWGSTLSEITERCERYEILMGYKKAPLRIVRYDDE